MLMLLTILEATSGVDPLQWLINYGIAGIVIALLVLGRLRTKSEVDFITKAREEALAREREKDLALQAILAQLTNHTMPQLTQTAQIVERVAQHAGDTPAMGVNVRDADLARKVDLILSRLDALEVTQRGEDNHDQH